MGQTPEQFDELLSAYLDGELTGEEQARVERALSQSAELRQLHEELRALRVGLQSLPQLHLGDDFAQRVLARAQREMALPASSAAGSPGTPRETASKAQPASLAASTFPARRPDGRKGWQFYVAATAALAAGVLLTVLIAPAIQRPGGDPVVVSPPPRKPDAGQPLPSEAKDDPPAKSDFVAGGTGALRSAQGAKEADKEIDFGARPAAKPAEAAAATNSIVSADALGPAKRGVAEAHRKEGGLAPPGIASGGNFRNIERLDKQQQPQQDGNDLTISLDAIEYSLPGAAYGASIASASRVAGGGAAVEGEILKRREAALGRAAPEGATPVASTIAVVRLQAARQGRPEEALAASLARHRFAFQPTAPLSPNESLALRSGRNDFAVKDQAVRADEKKSLAAKKVVGEPQAAGVAIPRDAKEGTASGFKPEVKSESKPSAKADAQAAPGAPSAVPPAAGRAFGQGVHDEKGLVRASAEPQYVYIEGTADQVRALVRSLAEQPDQFAKVEPVDRAGQSDQIVDQLSQTAQPGSSLAAPLAEAEAVKSGDSVHGGRFIGGLGGGGLGAADEGKSPPIVAKPVAPATDKTGDVRRLGDSKSAAEKPSDDSTKGGSPAPAARSAPASPAGKVKSPAVAPVQGGLADSAGDKQAAPRPAASAADGRKDEAPQSKLNTEALEVGETPLGYAVRLAPPENERRLNRATTSDVAPQTLSAAGARGKGLAEGADLAKEKSDNSKVDRDSWLAERPAPTIVRLLLVIEPAPPAAEVKPAAPAVPAPLPAKPGR